MCFTYLRGGDVSVFLVDDSVSISVSLGDALLLQQETLSVSSHTLSVPGNPSLSSVALRLTNSTIFPRNFSYEFSSRVVACRRKKKGKLVVMMIMKMRGLVEAECFIEVNEDKDGLIEETVLLK